jgi:acyl-CoA thioesterase-1
MKKVEQLFLGATALLAVLLLSGVAGCGGDEWPAEQVDRSAVGDVEDPNPSDTSDPTSDERSPWSNFDFGENNRNAYVALGDSITAECGYPEDLDGMLGQGKAVINKGIPGEESAGGLSRVSDALNSYGPGYLLVLYGANDLMHGVSNGEIVDNLRAIVRAALAAKTLPLVATVTPQPRYAQNRADVIANLNSHIMAMAEEENVPCVDLAAEFDGAGFELFPDGLHPNSTGARIIAMSFYETLMGL